MQEPADVRFSTMILVFCANPFYIFMRERLGKMSLSFVHSPMIINLSQSLSFWDFVHVQHKSFKHF